MTTSTALLCAHADVDGDPTRCPCFVPPGMKAEEWEAAANGQHYRILTSHGQDGAYLFAIQNFDGSIDDATVVHVQMDEEELTGEDARRIGRALLNAAAQLDALTGAR